ncbi:MAG: peptidoglycan DD-metalloendopeptidase family protein [Clostridium sp.]|nr:peptidoglycan DD-metalloendopeptidase family protein [Clostridium sp.]MCM1399201.1 peptidoglycan DD-metalloendopeptidase family protein [Clostridium sp.]MCM1459223.1 peptidoglycan DD-metalloendopeptidase family protein [Bacteroides sp.]
MRRSIKTVVTFALIAAIGLSNVTYVKATSISDLQEEKKENESKKEEAEGILSQLEQEQLGIKEAIKELDAKVSEYNTQIVELEAQRTELEGEIETTKKELEDAQADEKKQYEAMKLRIQYAYENGNVDYMDTLFSSSDVADMVNKSEYVDQIYKYDAKMLADLISIRKLIADTQVKLESDLSAVKEIEAEVSESKEALEIVINGKEKQVANYGESIDQYEAMVAEYQKAIEETDAAIAEAERKAAEAAAAAAAAGNGGTVYYTGGALGWPVNGYYYISSYFGPRDLLGMSFHHGVDIPCPTGTPIVASEAGTVITAGWSYSLGNYVVIDHGGGMTTVYGHNSSFAVSTGMVVSKGQVIAYAGSTGQSTGPHCHIAVRINGNYVDPLPYLQ